MCGFAARRSAGTQCAGCVGLVLVVWGFDNLTSVETQGIFRHSKTANILQRKVILMKPICEFEIVLEKQPTRHTVVVVVVVGV